MSLPARQQRALDRIDRRLAVDDPGLGSMFATFTRLTLEEPMPATERVSARLKRLLPSVVISIALVAGLVVLSVRMPAHSTSMCGFTLAESRIAQAFGRTRTCQRAPANPQSRLADHSGQWASVGVATAGLRARQRRVFLLGKGGCGEVLLSR
jgi:Protein of unknown function (DUF3040)